jgi:adenylate cyclase
MTFLGDAVMATFGAEGDDEETPVRAVMAALGMFEKLAELNARWQQEGKPAIRIGVGINTGEVMVGDVGFTGHHEFAAMGDNTNLAARIEKLTREYDAGILISGSTHNRVQHVCDTRHLGSTKVKGKQIPVDIYEVTGVRQ